MRKRGSSRASAKGPGKRSCPSKRTSGPRATATVATAITTSAEARGSVDFPLRQSRARRPARGAAAQGRGTGCWIGRAEGRRQLAPDVIPGAGGQERLEGGGEKIGLLAARARSPAGSSAARCRGKAEEGEPATRGAGQRAAAGGASGPTAGAGSRRQHQQADHAVIAAGSASSANSSGGTARRARGRSGRSGTANEQDQRQPLRAQRAEVRDLVGADRREREGGAGQQRRQLRGAEEAREEIAVRPESEREEPGHVVEQYGVVGEEGERQHEHGTQQVVHPSV